MLPIGISFYTFESISYTIDVYRRQVRAGANSSHYAAFVSFFPHLIAGPIVRYSTIEPQLQRSAPRLSPQLAASGLFLSPAAWSRSCSSPTRWPRTSTALFALAST